MTRDTKSDESSSDLKSVDVQPVPSIDYPPPKKPGLAPSSLPVSEVIVHPLVLLSVVDHFTRVSKQGNLKRVVGILLGSWKENRVLDVSNSFAVPFDEDDKDKPVWFLDIDYLENMYHMFRKVNAREKIVGWYHTGPKLHPNDIEINELIKKHCTNSVLVIVDAKPKDLGLPTDAYIEVEELHDDGTPPIKTFEHVPSKIGAEEAEEVGVEHLLRDIKDQTAGTLSQRITDQLAGLKGLDVQLSDIRRYLSEVSIEKMPVNNAIVFLLQDTLNLLPDTSIHDFVRSCNTQINDQMMAIYVGSLVRAVIALHNLINNKLSLRDAEKGDGKDPKKDEKEKEKKEDKDKGEKEKEKEDDKTKKSDEKK